MEIISKPRTIVPALDVSSKMEEMLEATRRIGGVGAYAVGFQPVFELGLKKVCKIIRNYTLNKPIIVKAPNIDHPSLGESFAKTVKNAGANAIILIPYACIRFQEEWTKAIQDQGLEVIIGGDISHNDPSHHGIGIYGDAVFQGVTNFLIPAKSDKVKDYPNLIKKIIDKKDPTFYAQGIETEEDISELKEVIGDHRLHLIIGKEIYEADDMRKATLNLAKKLQ